MKVIHSQEFETVLAGSKTAVLVDFFATWCGPCKMFAPILEAFAAENAGKVEVYKVDIDQDPELAQKFGVMSVPTIISFKDGKVYKKAVGVQQKDALLEMI